MDVKFLRFLELSSEFCKEPEDYKGFSNIATGTTCISGTSYSGTSYSGTSYSGIVLSTDNYASTVSPSKLEQFKSQKQSEIEKAERWEEFLELKNDLKQYLEAKIKLTK